MTKIFKRTITTRTRTITFSRNEHETESPVVMDEERTLTTNSTEVIDVRQVEPNDANADRFKLGEAK